MITFVCKYTPVELFAGFGIKTTVFDKSADSSSRSDQATHANLCGFGKSLLESALAGEIPELVLVNCCDVMRRAYDVLNTQSCCRFLYLLDLPHTDGPCQIERFARSLTALQKAYAQYSGRPFNTPAFLAAFSDPPQNRAPYVAILGARTGKDLEALIATNCPYPVKNLTCVGNRQLQSPPASCYETDPDALMYGYAQNLLNQIPCRRMADKSGRRSLFLDPALRGIIYHTIQFCDYYTLEYTQAARTVSVPITKIETDYTLHNEGQLRTRIDAFNETLQVQSHFQERNHPMDHKHYFAGIDSGSTSTDAVIIDGYGNLLSTVILSTGGGAKRSADEALDQALDKAHLTGEQLSRVIATGYGRANITIGDEEITEITCHAKGAHYLCPDARTVIDIGGQDSKAIRIDASGAVKNFVMNDKCAAGTGRFLEMMARTLGLSLKALCDQGQKWQKEITISSMCTVFAESEVVSLVAQNIPVPDIIHGLDKAVATKVATLVSRVGGEDTYIITGGVAKNPGVVSAIENRLHTRLFVSDQAQICGALGAARIAAGL